jgi:protein-tyrosine phosphatase
MVIKEDLLFDGLYNFRDIGGLETSDGRRMKTGILYRSDELSRLSERDIEKMRKLGIQLICDLRTAREQKSKPSKLVNKEGITIVNVSIYDQSQEFSRFEFFKFLTGSSKIIDFRKIMTDLYSSLAFTSGEDIRKILLTITEQNQLPVLIHCTGGKDRTGFIAAILQLAAGVPYQKVMDHYLYSNEVIGPRMKKIETFIRWMSLFRAKPEQIRPVLEVRREYLDEVYQEIIARYGDINTYLASVCGVSEETFVKLRKMLVE